MRHRAFSIVMTAAMGLAALGANAGAGPSASGGIAFHSDRDGGNYQIYIMNMDGSHPTRIATLVNALYPAFSPDGRKIAFVSEPLVRDFSSRRGEIYIMNVDGSHLTRLITLPGDVDPPAFSPDGRRIVFGASDQIYIMNVDGSHLTRLTNLAGGARQPAVSPDGRRIAFFSEDPMPTRLRVGRAHTQIYIMDADGSHITALTHLPAENGWPTFSPDGRRIAFVPARQGLYIMDVDGSHLRFLATPGAMIASPKFSPDGRKIVFAYYDTRDYGGVAGIWQIYMMDADGSHLTPLTTAHPPAFNGNPVFAP